MSAAFEVRHCECGEALPLGSHRLTLYCADCADRKRQRRIHLHRVLSRGRKHLSVERVEAELFRPDSTLALWSELRKRLGKTGRVWLYRVGRAWRFVWPCDRDGFKRANPGAVLVGKYDAQSTEKDVREDTEAVE